MYKSVKINTVIIAKFGQLICKECIYVCGVEEGNVQVCLIELIVPFALSSGKGLLKKKINKECEQTQLE